MPEKRLIPIGLMFLLGISGVQALLSTRISVLLFLSAPQTISSLTGKQSAVERVSKTNHPVYKEFKKRTLPYIKSQKKSSCKTNSAEKGSKGCYLSSKSSKSSPKSKSKRNSKSKSKWAACHPTSVPSTSYGQTMSPTVETRTKAPGFGTNTNTPTVSMMPSVSPQPSLSLAPTVYNCASPGGRISDINTIVNEISGTPVEGSPEYQAVDWILNTDNTFGCGNAIVSLRQRYILAIFYYMTNGDTWSRNDNWLQPEVPECTWFGVICDSNGLVISLELDSNQISGSLPSELGALNSLCELHVYQNAISGELPTELGKLTCLSMLDLEANSFSGPLFPPELFDTSGTIQYLRGSNNNFSGSIPSSVGLLSSLKELWAADNQLTGSIPPEITSLTNLASVFLYGNQMTGTIPSDFGTLSTLSELDLSSNSISGTVPSSIGNLQQLTRLGLRNMKLNGSIPSSVGTISSLVTILLDQNNFSGPIPPGIGSLPSLGYLIINQNQLTGTLPGFVSKELEFFDASRNRLGGAIPSVIFTLPKIHFLYFSNNTFNGTIPSNYGSSASLNDLWLDGNRLSGSIPAVPSNGFSNITQLLLNNNYFVGSVPDSICAVRTAKPVQFRSLHADCQPKSGGSGQAQNNCAPGCCTSCFIGPLAP